MGKYDNLNTADDIFDFLCSAASSALKSRGVTAIEHVYAYPRQSLLQLAKKLENNVTQAGLEVAIYREAISKTLVRPIAKELLFRKIVQEYPDGWTTFDEIGPIVSLVDWVYTFKSNVKSRHEMESAQRVYIAIARDTLPAEGWMPESAADPYLVDLFDRNWPVLS